MNKTDKLVAALLGLLLAGYVWHSFNESKKASEAQAQYLRDLAEWEKAHPEEVAREKAAAAAKEKAAAPAQTSEARPSVPAKAEKPRPPERLVTLTNAQGKAAFVFSTRGAALKSATLFEFATRAGERGEDNPPLSLDFSSSPALALDGVDGLAPDADWSVKELTATGVVFAAGTVTRRISVLDDYRIGVEEDFGGARAAAATKLSLGVMQRGSKDGILSIDSMLLEGEKPGVRHWDEEAPLQGYLSSGVSGGVQLLRKQCGGASFAHRDAVRSRRIQMDRGQERIFRLGAVRLFGKPVRVHRHCRAGRFGEGVRAAVRRGGGGIQDSRCEAFLHVVRRPETAVAALGSGLAGRYGVRHVALALLRACVGAESVLCHDS